MWKARVEKKDDSCFWELVKLVASSQTKMSTPEEDAPDGDSLPEYDSDVDDDELHSDEQKRCAYCTILFPNSYVLSHHSKYCTEKV